MGKRPRDITAVRLRRVRELAEGHAQFGVGTMRLVTRAAQGLPILLLAPVFQSSGTEIYYRADGDFASPGALAKAGETTIGDRKRRPLV